MSDEVCGAMLALVLDGRGRVLVCARSPHERGRHKTYDGAEWGELVESQPVTRAASR